MGHSPKTVMLQFKNPIRVIEWSSDTRGNGEPDDWEELHFIL